MIGKTLFRCLVFILATMTLFSIEDGSVPSSQTKTTGTLSFVHDNSIQQYSERLENFLRERLESNEKTKELLISVLKNGNIRVVLHHNKANDNYKRQCTALYGSQCACYTPSTRTIQISQIDPNNTESFAETINALGTSSDLYRSSKLLNDTAFSIGRYLVLSQLIFETVNALNCDSGKLSFIELFDYSNDEEYARATEIAEFETMKLNVVIGIFGVDHCNWPREVFIGSSLCELEDLAHTGKGPHYQFYVEQYNRNRVYNMTRHYLRKPYNAVASLFWKDEKKV